MIVKEKHIPRRKGNTYNDTHMVQDESDSNNNPILILTTINNELESIYDW